MLRTVASVSLLVFSAVLTAGCGPRTVVQAAPPVLVPPRVDLASLEQIGVVEFRSTEQGGLGSLATQRFVESARRDQGLVRMVDLGPGRAGEADVALGREKGVRTLVTGEIQVSRVRPRVRLATDLASGSVNMSLEATLAVRLVEVETGASIWSRSAKASRSVGNVGVYGHGDVVFDAGDPDGVYAQLVDSLVEQVTGDFHARWVRR
jgi:hypothetical protein